MANRNKSHLIGKFENDDVPTGEDFSDLISSSLNLHEPLDTIQRLTSSLIISGTLSASGDVYVGGNVEASSYTISTLAFGSIDNITTSGSVTFGDSASEDNHRMTGSLYISGATVQFTSTNTNFLNSVNIGTTSSPQGKLGGGLTVSNSLTMGTTSHHQSQSISSSILITGSNSFGHLAMGTNEILHWNDNLTIGAYGGNNPTKGNIKFLTSMGVDSVATTSTKLFISASGRVGIGTIAPLGTLHLKHASEDINSYIETDKTDGYAKLNFLNDAQQYAVGINTDDTFLISDTTSTETPFIIKTSSGNNTLVLDGGNVGIGINTPLEKLQVVGNISASGTLNASCSAAPIHHAGILAIVYDSGSNQFHYTGSYGAGGVGGGGIFKETGSFYATTNNIEITGSLKATGDVNFSDNLSIGLADNTGNKFHVKTATPFPALFENTSTTTGMGIQFKDGLTTKIISIGVKGNDLQLLTDNSVRLQINDDGKVGIGRTPGTYKLEVQGDMAATADVIAYMASDRRLKDNIKPITNPIEKIKQIGGYTFDWNDNQSTYKGNDVGVIAQEIEDVLPSLVKDREGGYKGVKYDKIVSLLIEGIKDQQTQIDDLKRQFNNLK